MKSYNLRASNYYAAKSQNPAIWNHNLENKSDFWSHSFQVCHFKKKVYIGETKRNYKSIIFSSDEMCHLKKKTKTWYQKKIKKLTRSLLRFHHMMKPEQVMRLKKYFVMKQNLSKTCWDFINWWSSSSSWRTVNNFVWKNSHFGWRIFFLKTWISNPSSDFVKFLAKILD